MSQKNVAILGGQWGDEGKGKIVDYAAEHFQVVARATGGNNAGHTIYLNGHKHIFHLLPSSITWDHAVSILGNGMVIDPFVLLKEIKVLQDKGYVIKNLNIAGNAHVIMLYHKLQDGYQERSKKGNSKIGTTKRGIGPTYADKKHRTGVRINDLLDKKILANKIMSHVLEKFALFKHIYEEDHDDAVAELISALPEEEMFSEYKEVVMAEKGKLNPIKIAEVLTEIYWDIGKKLKQYVTDARVLLKTSILENKNVLLEGAQGILLDIDHGTYPYVTSSNPSVGGLKTGLGVSRIDQVYSLIKAYTTRVGGGPFPTELEDETGKYLRDKGGEYGSTTGRPRRCGWHDAILMRHTAHINGGRAVITKLDVLTGLSKLKICNAYKYTGPQRIYNGEMLFSGKLIRDFPTDASVLEHCMPEEFVEMNGWSEDITHIRNYEELPLNAKKYLEMMEITGEMEIALVSVGPERDQVIPMKDRWLHNIDKQANTKPQSTQEPKTEVNHEPKINNSQPEVTHATQTQSETVLPTNTTNTETKTDNKNNQYKAIIYDFDNTLVATDDFVCDLMRKTAQMMSLYMNFRVPPVERIQEIQRKNLGFEDMFDELFPNPDGYQGSEPLAKVVLAKYREQAKQMHYLPTPNGIEFVKKMKQNGLVQGIVTNRVKMISERLNQAGYPQLEFAIAPETKEHRKPNPLAFKGALEQLEQKGIKKEEILVLGDHTHDYLAARDAGLEFIGVLTGLTGMKDFENAGLPRSRIVEHFGQIGIN